MVTVMGAAHESANVYIGQGRILEMVATGAVYDGTLHDLSRDVGLPSATLRACLRELVQVGWVAVQTQPFGRLTIRLERRTLGRRLVRYDRRHPVPDAWEL